MLIFISILLLDIWLIDVTYKHLSNFTYYVHVVTCPVKMSWKMQNSGPEQLNSLQRGTNLFLIHIKWTIHTLGAADALLGRGGWKMSPERLRAGDPPTRARVRLSSLRRRMTRSPRRPHPWLPARRVHCLQALQLIDRPFLVVQLNSICRSLP